MSLSTNIQNFAIRVATEAKALRTLINGNTSDLSGLRTTAKTNLVSAINELVDAVGEGGTGGADIDDTGTSTLSVWSSAHTSSQISAAVDALVGASPGVLDTLEELANALGDDPEFATTITQLISDKTAPASETSAGTVELATIPETVDGVDAFRAVTPAGLRSVTGDSTVNFVEVFENGLA